jgi:CHAT domain-containing protein/Tfp pilus assembly protein PilF
MNFHGKRSVAACLLLFLLCVPSPSAEPKPAPRQDPAADEAPPEDAGALAAGAPVEREIAGGTAHRFRLALRAGQFVRVTVEQKGADVILALVAPDGAALDESDAPTGSRGTETVVAIVGGDGEYGVVVRSNADEPGRYAASLAEPRPATDADRKLVEARSLRAESVALYDQGKYAQAVAPGERAVATFEALYGADHPEIVPALLSLGEAHWKSAAYPKAEAVLLRALAIAEKALGPEHPLTSAALNDLAAVYQSTGAYEKAEPLFLRALAIDEKVLGPKHADTATLLNNLAVLYHTMGLFEKAQAMSARALAIYEATLAPDDVNLAIVLNNLASLYRTFGYYAKAEPLYLRARAIFEKALGPEHPYTASTLDTLGIMYRAAGAYREAEPLLARALAIREKALGPEHPETATSLTNLASVYSWLGEHAKAEPLLVRSLAIREKVLGPNHQNTANSLGDLGSLYVSTGAYAKAEPLLLRAVAVWEKAVGPVHRNTGVALATLATLYRDMGSNDEAERYGLRAIEVYSKTLGDSHYETANELVDLAAVYLAKGQVDKALDAMTRGDEARERDLTRNLVTGSEKRKLDYLAQSSGDLDKTISLHVRSMPADARASRLALETVLRRKGRALDAMAESVADLRRHASPEDAKLLDDLADARSRLSTLTLRGPGREGPDAHRTNLEALRAHVDALEGQISRRSAEFRARFAPISLDAVQAALPADASLVEYAVYRAFDTKAAPRERYGTRRYVAYVLARAGAPAWVDLGEAKAIDEAVDRLRVANRDPKRGDVKAVARALDALVFQPVRALLGARTHVLVSPDGQLNLVPFGSLVDERERFLLEGYRITYLTSGRDLLRLKERVGAAQPAVIVADPDFDDLGVADETPATQAGATRGVDDDRLVDFDALTFKRLPSTATEGQALGRMLRGAKVLTAGKASEAEMKRLRGPRILHLATHGFFLPNLQIGESEQQGEKRGAASVAERVENPLLRSGLALAGANLRVSGEGDDGVLTALEMAGLDLWGTRLAVLSACETGVGEVRNGDGVYGLRRALVLGGSESQVMSLWKVADRATRELMVAYYGGLLRGEGRGEALRRVQLAMMRRPATSHPFYWASFIQSGAWTALEGPR